MRFLFLTLCLVSCLQVHAEFRSLKVLAPLSEHHTSQRYFLDLLQLILDEREAVTGKQAYRLQFVPADKRINREDNMLSRGFVDIIWSGTNRELENKLLPVRLPLIAGLLGYRAALVDGKGAAGYESLDLQQWRQLSACQGEHWSDSDILELNRFRVKRVSQYDLMLKMLMRGKCDYFPRALHEVYFEYENAHDRYPGLAIMDDVIFYYPYAAYIFVGRTDQELADYLHQGFRSLIDSGKFATFMEQHALTKALLPMSKWQGKKLYKLHNPFLTPETPLQDDSLWLKIPN